MTLDQIGVIVGAVFTLLILSYLLGDNFLYRLATHILVAVGAAYIFVTVLADVLYPRLFVPLITRTSESPIDLIVVGLGFFFGFLLLFKLSSRWAFIGNISVGYLVGVGAAVTLGGALFGTLATQLLATANVTAGSMNLLLGLIIIFGTITTLLSFGFYRVARRGILSGINSIGRFFLSIGLGATFALVYVASVSLLIDRLQAISNAVTVLFPGLK